MSDRYNKLSNYPRINAKIIQQYLEYIGKIIRNYRKTRIHSLDAYENFDIPLQDQIHSMI